MKELKVEDFRKMYYSEEINESAFVGSRTDKIDINMSSTYTRLIQEAGRWCERYASDILIDINSVETFIKDWDTEERTKRFIFGFRENGVDHFEFIQSRYKNESCAGYQYRAIWVLDVFKDDEQKEISTKLFKADRP